MMWSWAGFAEIQSDQGSPYGGEVAGRHPTNYQVLFLCGAGFAASILPHDVGQAVELFGREIAPDRLYINHVISFLPLGCDVGVVPPAVFGTVFRGCCLGLSGWGSSRWTSSVTIKGR